MSWQPHENPGRTEYVVKLESQVALLRQALKSYYHECRCQRTEMDEVNRQAYAALCGLPEEESKP